MPDIVWQWAYDEIATDLSLLVFVTPDAANLPPNNGRVAVASTAQGLYDAVGSQTNDEVFWAAQAWSAKSPRAQRMAVGRVFEEAVPAQIMAAVITDFRVFIRVTGING